MRLLMLLLMFLLLLLLLMSGHLLLLEIEQPCATGRRWRHVLRCFNAAATRAFHSLEAAADAINESFLFVHRSALIQQKFCLCGGGSFICIARSASSTTAVIYTQDYFHFGIDLCNAPPLMWQRRVSSLQQPLASPRALRGKVNGKRRCKQQCRCWQNGPEVRAGDAERACDGDGNGGGGSGDNDNAAAAAAADGEVNRLPVHPVPPHLPRNQLRYLLRLQLELILQPLHLLPHRRGVRRLRRACYTRVIVLPPHAARDLCLQLRVGAALGAESCARLRQLLSGILQNLEKWHGIITGVETKPFLAAVHAETKLSGTPAECSVQVSQAGIGAE
jgi:hypothetical protein